jgi:hypothetical protein
MIEQRRGRQTSFDVREEQRQQRCVLERSRREQRAWRDTGLRWLMGEFVEFVVGDGCGCGRSWWTGQWWW